MNDTLRDAVQPRDTTLKLKVCTAVNLVEPYYTTAKAALEGRIAHLKQHNINPTNSSTFNSMRDANQTINVMRENIFDAVSELTLSSMSDELASNIFDGFVLVFTA